LLPGAAAIGGSGTKSALTVSQVTIAPTTIVIGAAGTTSALTASQITIYSSNSNCNWSSI
jgi:hypothetical protein